jgi:uncharacterized membrane protein required for colicin V production
MNISSIIDLVLVILTVTLVIRYTIKGAVKSIFSFVKTFLAIAVAYLFRNPIAKLINDMFMGNWVRGWVYDSLYASARGGEIKGINFVNVYEKTPKFFTNILSKFDMDLSGFNEAISSLPQATDEQIGALADNIGSSVSLLLSMILGMVVIFILSLLVLTFIINLFDKVTRLPVLNFVNRILGAVIGLLIAAMVIWAVNGVITMLITFVGPMAPNTFNEDIINNSYILSMLKDTNLVELIKSYIE